MEASGLTNIGMEGYSYTWSNKQIYPDMVEEKLDRVFANKPWCQVWKEFLIHSLLRYNSNHNPITWVFCKQGARRESRRKREKLYHFKKVWLNDLNFQDIMNASRIRGQSAISNLQRMTLNLVEWGDLNFGQISKQIKEMRRKLQNL